MKKIITLITLAVLSSYGYSAQIGVMADDSTGAVVRPAALATVLAGKVPNSRTVNGKVLSSDIVLTSADIADSINKRYVTDAYLAILANTSGVNTGDQTNITGNAGTATVLQTARTINGVGFNGSTNITIPTFYTNDGTISSLRTINVTGGGVTFTSSSGSVYTGLGNMEITAGSALPKGLKISKAMHDGATTDSIQFFDSLAGDTTRIMRIGAGSTHGNMFAICPAGGPGGIYMAENGHVAILEDGDTGYTESSLSAKTFTVSGTAKISGDLETDSFTSNGLAHFYSELTVGDIVTASGGITVTNADTTIGMGSSLQILGTAADSFINGYVEFGNKVFIPSAMFRINSSAYGSLPSASSAGAGAIAYVVDLSSTTSGATASGGGSGKHLVVSDGTNWIVQ